MIIDNSDMNKFGYYKAGDLTFYSRLEAFEVSKRLNLGKVTWHFNDEVFSSYDWTVEPNESLEELYRQRAQQLREKYDYLVLFFSGGADSTNILDTFIDNGIKLDELLSRVNYEGTGEKDNWMNGEIFNVAIPKGEEAKEKQPWLKHTVLDVVSDAMSLFKQSETKFNWIYEQNTYVGLNNYCQKILKESQKHWRDLTAAGKKIAFIHGLDKPRISGSDKGFYCYFDDAVDNAVSPAMQIANEHSKGYFSELFYWSPDAVKVVIKQAHVLKRVLKTIDVNSDWVSIGVPNSRVSSVRDKQLFFLKLNAVHREIYPKWKKVGWQLKPMSFVMSPRDEFFHKLSSWEKEKEWWKMGVEHMWSVMPEELRRRPDEMLKGFRQINSKYYFLGK